MPLSIAAALGKDEVGRVAGRRRARRRTPRILKTCNVVYAIRAAKRLSSRTVETD